jgi:hypothetical protein
MQLLRSFALTAAALLPAAAAAQQWNYEADPQHFKLEIDNDCVKVIRGTFGAGERSASMFDTKGVVVVMLTERKDVKLTTADGAEMNLPPLSRGSAYWTPSRGRIGLQNNDDARIEYLVIEPKSGCSN